MQRQMVTELISHDIIFKVTVSAKGSMIAFCCAPVCCLMKTSERKHRLCASHLAKAQATKVILQKCLGM